MIKEKLQLDSGFADNCSFNKDILRAYLCHALFQAQGKLVNSADLKSSAGKSNLTSPFVQLKYQLKNIFSQTFAIFVIAPSQIVLKKDYTLQYQRLCSHSQDLGMGSIYQCLVCACTCMCVSYYLYLCPPETYMAKERFQKCKYQIHRFHLQKNSSSFKLPKLQSAAGRKIKTKILFTRQLEFSHQMVLVKMYFLFILMFL